MDICVKVGSWGKLGHIGSWGKLARWPCNLTSRLLQATSPWLMSIPRWTSIWHKAMACNECQTSGVWEKEYCSQLLKSRWTTLFRQLLVKNSCRNTLGCGAAPQHPVQPVARLQKTQSSDRMVCSLEKWAAAKDATHSGLNYAKWFPKQATYLCNLVISNLRSRECESQPPRQKPRVFLLLALSLSILHPSVLQAFFFTLSAVFLPSFLLLPNFLPAFLPPFLPLPKLSSFRPSLLSLQKPCSFLPSLLSKKSRESVGKKGKEAPQKNPLQPCTPTLFGFLDIMHARTCVCISLYYEEQILWYSTRLVHHHNKSQKKKQKKVVSLYINVSPRFLKKKGESGLTCDRVSVCEYSCLCQWHCTSWMFLVYWAEHLRCVSWKQFQKLMPTKNDTPRPQQESKKDKQGCLLVFLLVEGMWRNQSVQILVLRQWFRSSWRYFLHPARSTSHSYVLWCTSQQTFFVKTHEIQHPS